MLINNNDDRCKGINPDFLPWSQLSADQQAQYHALLDDDQREKIAIKEMWMSSQGYNGQITDEVREQLLERWNNRKCPAAGGAAPQRKKGPESYESRKQTIRQTFGQLGYEPDDEDMRVLHRSAKQGETSMPEYLWQRV